MAHKVLTARASRAQSHLRAIAILLLFPTSTFAACPQDPIFLPVGNCTINIPGLPTIHSWGAPISVSPSSYSSTLQYLCGVPSTVTNTTFYTTSLLCSDANIRAQNLTYAQCLSRRGGGLLVSPSGEPLGPDALATTSTANLFDSDPGWATIMKPDPPFPAAVSATLHLHGRDSITMTAGLIEAGTNHTTTHLSLGDKSVLLSSLVASKRIAVAAFGFDAGSQSHSLPRAGGLVLGGWDDGARAGTEVRFPMADYREAHQLNGRRTCPLQVTISSMVLRPAGGGGDGSSTSSDYPLGIEPAHPQQACIEMYDNLPRLPSGVIAKIRDGFQAFTGSAEQPIRYTAADPTAPFSHDNEGPLAQLQEIYIPEPGLIYPTTNLTEAFNGSLVITLAENNFTVEIPLEELLNPVRGIARDGTRVVNANFTELAVYQDPAPEDAAVLGKVFLSRVYLYVDYDKGEFTLAQAATSGRTILVAAGDDEGGTCGGGGWTRVTIALVAVVAVLGVALLGGLAYWLWRRRGRGGGTSGNGTFVWPWRRGGRAKEQPLIVANGGTGGDDPEVYRGPATTMAQVPIPGTNQAPPADITPVPTERTIPPPTGVEQQSPSHEYGNAGFRPRLDSVEVPGTSPLDPAYSPDGQHPELDGRERTLVSDSPRTHEMVEMAPVRSSFGAQRHHPIERLRKGSGSTSADSDPLHVTRTNRSMSGQSWV